MRRISYSPSALKPPVPLKWSRPSPDTGSLCGRGFFSGGGGASILFGVSAAIRLGVVTISVIGAPGFAVAETRGRGSASGVPIRAV